MWNPSEQSTTERGSSAKGHAALTPLLDTLFLLLFAVLASSDEKAARSDAAREVKVELPSVEDAADGASVDEPNRPVVVVIEAGGQLTVEGESDSIEVPQDLAAIGALDRPDVSVEIRAHGDARHAVVVEVLHELQQMGVVDVRFVATRREATPRAISRGEVPGR